MFFGEGIAVASWSTAFQDASRYFFALGQALGLGDRKFVEDFLDDRLGGFLLGLGLERDGHAMAEDVLRDAFDILRRDKAATPEEGVRLSREGEGHRGWARRR